MYFIYLFSPLWQELNDERTSTIQRHSQLSTWWLGLWRSEKYLPSGQRVPCTMGKKGSVKVVEFVPALSAAGNGELIAQA